MQPNVLCCSPLSFKGDRRNQSAVWRKRWHLKVKLRATDFSDNCDLSVSPDKSVCCDRRSIDCHESPVSGEARVPRSLSNREYLPCDLQRIRRERKCPHTSREWPSAIEYVVSWRKDRPHPQRWRILRRYIDDPAAVGNGIRDELESAYLALRRWLHDKQERNRRKPERKNADESDHS